MKHEWDEWLRDYCERRNCCETHRCPLVPGPGALGTRDAMICPECQADAEAFQEWAASGDVRLVLKAGAMG